MSPLDALAIAKRLWASDELVRCPDYMAEEAIAEALLSAYRAGAEEQREKDAGLCLMYAAELGSDDAEALAVNIEREPTVAAPPGSAR